MLENYDINNCLADVECVYYDGRAKTGVRTGAIESINQRIGE